MAAIALRHLQRTLRRSPSSVSLQSSLLSGLEVSSRPTRGEPTGPGQSNLRPACRKSAAAYSSGRSPGYSYASDVQTYNNLISQINSKRRHYLSRDVYEDMLLDGVQPIRDTFYLLITGCTQSGRLQDVMFFFDEMKAMGITPDVSMYNCIIAACGRSQQVDRAFQVAEEMEAFGIQPKQRTFVALLRACAVAGRLDEAYGLVRRMAAYGLTLDNYCYAALITAHKNMKPQNEETTQKIFELLEQSKVPSTLDAMEVAATGEVESGDEAEDFLLNFISGDDVQFKRGLINRRLTVYHAAMSAFQELGNREAVKKVLEMIKHDGHTVDAYCIKQVIKCYIDEGDFEKACSEYNQFLELGRRPNLDLYLILIEGALSCPSPTNSEVAQKLLAELVQKGFFLNLKTSGDLLRKACQDKTRDTAVAGMVWEMSQNRGLKFPIVHVMEYYRALERSGTPKDDPRMTELRSLLDESRRFGKGPQSSRTAAAAPASPSQEQVQEEPTNESSEQIVSAETDLVEEPVDILPAAEQPESHSEDAGDTATPAPVQQ